MLYLKFPVNLALNKFYSNGKKLYGQFHKCHAFASNKIQNVSGSTISTFDKMLSERRKQAERSIIVSSHRNDSIEKIITWSSQFGVVKNVFVINMSSYILVEYETPWQESNHLFSYNVKQVPSVSVGMEQMFPITKVDHKRHKSIADIYNLLAEQDSIDRQIMEFYHSCSADDVEIRIKFLAALQIEKTSEALFPSAIVYPIGSTVYGLGQNNSDLDLVLEYKYAEPKGIKNKKIEHAKYKHRVTLLANHIKDAEYISNVESVLKAVVPIVKYQLDLFDLNIDLSMNNRDGRKKSELIYLLGEIDSRVRPLILFIRWWARLEGITDPKLNGSLSNFGLTLLVIYFLQQLDPPILPSVDELEKCQFQSRNTSSLSKLLLQFLEFYSSFDFYGFALSLNAATVVEKPSSAPIYIIDPVDNDKNITRVVTPQQCERISEVMIQAYFKLGSEIKESTGSKRCRGVLVLVENNKTNS